MHVLAVAARYLTRRWINLLPAAAVAVGVSMLLCTISITMGFRKAYSDALASMKPDLVVYIGNLNTGGARELDIFLSEIESAPEIVAASPVFRLMGHLAWRTGRLPDGTWLTDSDGLEITGVDFERERRVMDMKRVLGSGEDPFAENASTPQGPLSIVVGAEVFDAVCQASVPGGSQPSRDTSILQLRFIDRAKGRTRMRGARAVGALTRTGWKYMDRSLALVPIDQARKLMGRDADEINGLHIRLADRKGATVLAAEKHIKGVAKARETKRCIIVYRPSESTWPVMTFERIMHIIMLLLIVSAGFTLAAVMILSVFQKKPDIGILRSMGCSKKGIAGIFLLYGALTGAAGAAAGCAVALVVLHNIDAVNSFILVPLGVSEFTRSPFVELNGIPWQWSWAVFGVLAGVAVLTGLAAGIVPALKAARLDPVRSIRGE